MFVKEDKTIIGSKIPENRKNKEKPKTDLV